jgi:hypothetical protein
MALKDYSRGSIRYLLTFLVRVISFTGYNLFLLGYLYLFENPIGSFWYIRIYSSVSWLSIPLDN